ncbi:MAG: hypothetical protein GW947_04330 [Candidatus Pacebacteria bacterium]|nr:hypothetical protein [Candidatus Paceibacterota bacterium]PIR59654.1 MAG: hypothetical protein COU68_04435 [Candidatus Pacebacteria bacterium CG10_big_fil_rev_8_21_14_0_10_45_6]
MFNKLLPVKVSPTQYELLKATAKEQQTTISKLVRQALDKELALLKQRNRLSDFALIAQAFPQENSGKSDDEIAYDI